MVAGAGLLVASAAHGLSIYGGPALDFVAGSGFNGHVEQNLSTQPGSSAADGMAVGNGSKIESSVYKDSRALRWGVSGAPAVELGQLGTALNGETQVVAHAISTAGAAVGEAVGGAVKYESGARRMFLMQVPEPRACPCWRCPD